MRVISGRFKGFQLPTAKTGTRPTTDRTKEAIFSHLDSWGVLDGARVLDLFAGTGALGIEALSRGAKELTAVEAAGPAAALLGKTFGAIRASRAWERDMTARALRTKAESFAAKYAGPGFDLILIDPPYALETEACNRLLADIAANGVAAPGAIVMFERSTRSEPLTPPDGWEVAQARDYGETAVTYFERTQ